MIPVFSYSKGDNSSSIFSSVGVKSNQFLPSNANKFLKSEFTNNKFRFALKKNTLN